MSDLDRETVGRMVLPVLELLAETVSVQMSLADKDELERAMSNLRAYFAPAKKGA